MSPRQDVSMTASEIAAFLVEPRTAVLTTLDRDGWPHSAGMWFAPAPNELHMWTYSKSQKAINVRRDPRGAILVEDGTAYMELKGVLVRGHVKVTTDFDAVLDIGLRLYERYTLPATGVPASDGPVAELSRQAAKRVGLILPMERVASWDHGKLAGRSG